MWKKCDSCINFVDKVDSFRCHATGKVFKIHKAITCNTPNIIYMAYCTKCKKQGVGSTEDWKPRLRNYKSHIKRHVYSCSIVRQCIDDCPGNEVNPSKYLRFVLLDFVNNVSAKDHENIMLQKEKFWIGSICAIHKGLNGYHDWRRTRRVQKFKIGDW